MTDPFSPRDLHHPFPVRRSWPLSDHEEARIVAVSADLQAYLVKYWAAAEKRDGALPPADFLRAIIAATASVAVRGNGYVHDPYDKDGTRLAEAFMGVWRDQVIAKVRAK